MLVASQVELFFYGVAALLGLGVVGVLPYRIFRGASSESLRYLGCFQFGLGLGYLTGFVGDTDFGGELFQVLGIILIASGNWAFRIAGRRAAKQS